MDTVPRGTPEREALIERVTAAWREGQSSKDISVREGVTRNTIIGIVQRYQSRFGKIKRAYNASVGCVEKTRVKKLRAFRKPKETVVKSTRVDKYVGVVKVKRPPRPEMTKAELRAEIEEALRVTAGIKIIG